jgi:hypothetical protein
MATLVSVSYCQNEPEPYEDESWSELSKRQKKKVYNWRIKQETIDDVYIPKNLQESLAVLDTMLADSIKQEIQKMEEGDASADLHFGLGLWLRNEWGFWRGSRLSSFFNSIGIFHPDDMSGIILTSFHRQINNKPIELENQIKYYQDYWAKRKPQKKVKE